MGVGGRGALTRPSLFLHLSLNRSHVQKRLRSFAVGLTPTYGAFSCEQFPHSPGLSHTLYKSMFPLFSFVTKKHYSIFHFSSLIFNRSANSSTLYSSISKYLKSPNPKRISFGLTSSNFTINHFLSLDF
jgi:hypothetical protein